MDPQTETAAKCNYCAHRVEVGLEPPCVTVCPTQAIVAGDLDDASSQVARIVGREAVQVRKPEKGTRPRVFYVEADAASLEPAAAPPASDYMWSTAPQPAQMPLSQERGAPRRAYGVKEQHRHSWGWRVSGYLWTKSIAAGVYLVPALAWLRDPWTPMTGAVPLIAAVFLLLTGLLLITDLRQPQRFLWTLTRPQWRSWLVRGSYILAAYGAVLGVEVVLRVAGLPPRRDLTALGVLLAVASAVYTAFLFGQAKGRDLWQSPLLAPHLLVQALVAGAALVRPGWLLVLLPVNGLMLALEVWGRHATADAARAAALIQRDPRFSAGVLILGHVAPLSLLQLLPEAGGLAGGLALIGLLVQEHLYVQAPQRIPLA
jgi:formate-dependent nitrite reductase membrane component NrfD